MNINDVLVTDDLKNVIVLEAGGTAYVGILVNSDDIGDSPLKRVVTSDSIVLKYPVKLMLTFQGGVSTSLPLNNLSETPSQRSPYLVINPAGFAIGVPTQNLVDEYRKIVASQYFGIDVKKEQIIVPPDVSK